MKKNIVRLIGAIAFVLFFAFNLYINRASKSVLDNAQALAGGYYYWVGCWDYSICTEVYTGYAEDLYYMVDYYVWIDD